MTVDAGHRHTITVRLTTTAGKLSDFVMFVLLMNFCKTHASVANEKGDFCISQTYGHERKLDRRAHKCNIQLWIGCDKCFKPLSQRDVEIRKQAGNPGVYHRKGLNIDNTCCLFY